MSTNITERNTMNDELRSYEVWYGFALAHIALDALAATKDERRQAKAMAEAAMRGQLDRERIDRERIYSTRESRERVGRWA
jgi:hypothetical protein